jgi:hypothetical protein
MWRINDILTDKTTIVIQPKSSSKDRKPEIFNFKAKKKHAIQFPNRETALKYLALPVEQYKVLSSSYVEHSPLAANEFLLVFSLKELFSNETGFSNDVNLQVLTDYKLVGSIHVESIPEEGKITMESGEFFLKRVISSTTDTENMVMYDSSFNQTLPDWMIWEDSSEGNQSKNNQGPSTKVKTFLQPRFRSEIKWNPNPKENLLSTTISKSMKSNWFQGIFKKKETSSEADEVEIQSGPTLEAKLTVEVGAEILITPNNILHGLGSLPTIRLVIETLISAALSRILSEQAIMFGKSLVEDCDDRFLKIPTPEAATQE